MGKLLNKVIEDLNKLDNANLHGLDNHSFQSGYSNGFMKGYYYAKRGIATILIILALSLFLNFMNFLLWIVSYP